MTITPPTISAVHAGWFGASPAATAAVNSAAINKAIELAKASQNANMVIGAGTFEIDSTLIYSGANQGITTIGTPEGSVSQGSTPGNCVLKWVGGASPMIDVSGTFHTFHGFSLQNNGSATHGIRCTVGGRQWMDRLHFSCPVGASGFSVASIELGSASSGVNYDRITRCEFEAGPALKVLGNGNTLLLAEYMADSAVGAGAFIDIQGSLDVMTIRDGTVNYQAAMATFIDMTSIGSYRVGVLRVEGNEFDGNSIAVQLCIAKLKNCDGALFDGNQISGFGNVANTESPITLTDSRATLRNNSGMVSINKPLVRTLDATSYVYIYENKQDLTNCVGLLEASSQSGNLIAAAVYSGNIVIQGDRASAMAHAVFVATITTSATYTVDVAHVTDSSNKGFMTKGQVFTLVFYNNTGADLGTILFNSTSFTVENPLPAPPPNGKRMAMTFIWDGTTARELMRQHDSNPAWLTKAASVTLTLSERRIAASAASGNITITLPRADTVQMGGRFLVKKVTAANTVTINSSAGYTIDGASSVALTAQWSGVEVESDGTQWLVIGLN